MKINFLISLALVNLALHIPLLADPYVPNWSKNISKNNDTGSIFYGPTTIENQTLDDLTIFGPSNINNATIVKTATVKGPVEVSHSTFSNFRIDGVAKFDEVKVKDLYINGALYAKNSTLNEVSIASSEMTLVNTQVQKLLVRKNNNPERQIVYLEKNSQVENIEFESRNGQVVLVDPTAVVSKIVGGQTQSGSNP